MARDEDKQDERRRRLYFGERYAETAQLGDGSRARLRCIRPSDKPLLVEGFSRLSPESRYLRFMTTKGQLTPAELSFLTEVDGWNHFALGAVLVDPPGEPVLPMGAARFVRVSPDAEIAEPALVVVDEFQGRGLGRLMLMRLAAAARERGIERFRCNVLSTNERLRQLMERLGPLDVVEQDGPMLIVESEVPEIPPDRPLAEIGPQGALDSLLRMAGQRLLPMALRLRERRR